RFLSHLPRSPTSALFPYTTLFRSPRRRPSGSSADRRRGTGENRGSRRSAPAVSARPVAASFLLSRRAQFADAGKMVIVGIDRLEDRKSTRLHSSHVQISYAVFCLK